ncbi:VIT1/CCC1 transporter family protein [Dellaglioa sp. BT-FLS60]
MDSRAVKVGMALSTKLNILRAGVLGANDGIISVAGVILGMAGASQGKYYLVLAGLAGMFAGAFSMAGGEYVSVSAQRDTQKSVIELAAKKLKENRELEVERLIDIYQAKGLSRVVATDAVNELMAQNELENYCKEVNNIDVGEYLNPRHAAMSSMVSFVVGSLVPLLLITLLPTRFMIPMTVIGVALALLLTGATSGILGHNNIRHAMLRNVVVGLITMVVTYYVGGLFG